MTYEECVVEGFFIFENIYQDLLEGGYGSNWSSSKWNNVKTQIKNRRRMYLNAAKDMNNSGADRDYAYQLVKHEDAAHDRADARYQNARQREKSAIDKHLAPYRAAEREREQRELLW